MALFKRTHVRMILAGKKAQTELFQQRELKVCRRLFYRYLTIRDAWKNPKQRELRVEFEMSSLKITKREMMRKMHRDVGVTGEMFGTCVRASHTVRRNEQKRGGGRGEPGLVRK